MRKRIVIAALAVVAAGIVTGGAIAAASSDSDGSVTGPDADRATQAALEATGGGTVSEVERDDEGGAAWEVEVETPDGKIVEVRLDERFTVVGVGGDDESPDTDDGTEGTDDSD
jgi:hypothetical protein